MKRIKIYAEICAGCRQCEMVCSFQNSEMFSPNFARVTVYKDDRNGLDYPVLCHQCSHCPPIEKCPTMAISKSSDGWTWVESRECIGCGICVDECRYDAIKITKQKAIICDLCWGDPECVKRCPTEALEYVEAPESFETPETVFKRLREAWKIE